MTSYFEPEEKPKKQFFVDEEVASVNPESGGLRNQEIATSAAYINNDYTLDENTVPLSDTIKDQLDLYGYSTEVEIAKRRVKGEGEEGIKTGIESIVMNDDAPELTLKEGRNLLNQNELDSTGERLVKSVSEQFAVDNYLKTSLESTEEEANRALEVAKSMTGFLDNQLIIREYEEKLTAYNNDISLMEAAGDIGLSVIIPFMETAGLGDVAATLNKEDFSAAGYVLPSQALEALRRGFAKSTPEEQREFVRNLYESAVNRNQVLGLADNRSANAAIASIALDALKDGVDINSPEFLGLRMPRVGDIGYDVIGALDVVGAVEIAKVGKGLINYLFGKTTKMVPTSAVSTIQNRGALFDGIAKADPETAKQVINSTNDIELAANKMGVTTDDLSGRSVPTPTDDVDDVSLPPAVTDSAVDDVYKTINQAHPLNLVYPEERTEVVSKAVKKLMTLDEGKVWTSSIKFKPGTTPESLGSWSVRYGADGTKPFVSETDANIVANQFKADGMSAKVVKKDSDYFVEVDYTHNLSGKDVSTFSSVSGEKLTTGDATILPYMLPPSRRFKGSVKKVQQTVSRAQDTSAILTKRLEEAAKPFTNLNQRDLEDASQALQRGASERRVFTEEELKALYPGITDKAVNGYFSARKVYDAIADVRNIRHRANLTRQGAKQIIGEDGKEFFGTILTNKPSILSKLPEDINKSTDLPGNRVYDSGAGRVVNISQEEIDNIYATGGRVVRLSSNFTDEASSETVRHMVVRNFSKTQVKELPNQTLARIDGYIERAYSDVGWMVVQKNAKARVNGIETTIPQRAIGAYEFPFQAKERLAQLPEGEFEVVPAREIADLLDEGGMGGSTAPSWLRKRGEKALEGPLDADGNPTVAATLDPLESIVRSVRKTGSVYLQQTEDVLRERFYNQFGNFLTSRDIAFSDFDPKMLSADKIRKAGLNPAQVRKDATNLHNYINNIREVAATPADTAIRHFLAEAARGLGQESGVIRNMASKALLKGASAAPLTRLRSLTSTLNIAWGVLFQTIQNVVSPLTLLAASGREEGFKSMVKTFELANAMGKRKTSDWAVVKKDLAKSLGVSEKAAEEFVDFGLNSGIFGTARHTDNLLRVINDTKRANAGQSAVAYYVQKGIQLPSYLTEQMSSLIAKSIDIGNMMYYTHSYRELVKKTGKASGKDFFEEVRTLTRELGQNQNSSDKFAYEAAANPAAFALQFIQHIHRLGVQGVEILNKGVLGKGHTPFAKSQSAAVKTIMAYSLLTGASGFGGEKGAAFINQYLPVDWPDELKQLAIGGLLDVAISSVGEGNVALSAKTSPGAAGEFTWSTLEATYQSLVNGVDSGFLETVFGASTSTMSNLAAAGKFMTLELKRTDIDSIDKALNLAQIVAETTKTGRDVLKAKVMLKMESNLTSTKLDANGRATVLEAVAKAFGFTNYTEVLHNQSKLNGFYDANEMRNTVEFLTKAMMRDYLDSPSYEAYLEKKRELTEAYSLIYTKDEVSEATKQTLRRIKNFIDTDKGVGRKLESDLSRFDVNYRIQKLDEYTRIPGISEESRQRALELIELLKNPPQLDSKEQ